MKAYRTDNGFGQDYKKIKQALKKDPVLRQDLKDPIREWQTWLDMDDEKLRDLTYYLLQELVFNEPLTSITKIIPLIENNDLKVGVTVYMDDECIYATNKVKNDYSPLFISANDIVNVLAELTEEDRENEYAIRYITHKLAWKLKIIDELKDKLK
jgi:hypothetical protein